jgi:hypothetical protein
VVRAKSALKTLMTKYFSVILQISRFQHPPLNIHQPQANHRKTPVTADNASLLGMPTELRLGALGYFLLNIKYGGNDVGERKNPLEQSSGPVRPILLTRHFIPIKLDVGHNF